MRFLENAGIFKSSLFFIAGLLLFLWALHLPSAQPGPGIRLSEAGALFGSLMVLLSSWAALLAQMGKRRKWTPNTCYRAGAFSLIASGVFVGVLSHGSLFSGWVNFLALGGILTGDLCRRLAYPEFENSEASKMTILNLHS